MMMTIITSWWRDVSKVKSICWTCIGSKFSSQHPCLADHNPLSLELQRTQCTLVWTPEHKWTHTSQHTNMKKKSFVHFCSTHSQPTPAPWQSHRFTNWGLTKVALKLVHLMAALQNLRFQYVYITGDIVSHSETPGPFWSLSLHLSMPQL